MLKKYFKLLLIVIVCFLYINVNALDYNTMELIPVGRTVTVETELFTYTDFVYSSDTDSKGNGKIIFKSITNKSDKKVPVSINILLFDSEKINIGYLSYCTNLDVSSDYSHFELHSKESTPFYIDVTKRYFQSVSEDDSRTYDDGNKEIVYSSKDVKYYAIQDDNKYCKTGGPTKYKGLTLEKIKGGEVDNQKKSTNSYDLTVKFIDNMSVWAVLIIIIVVALIIVIVEGIILNALYKRMHSKTSILSYLPIGRNYISIKLAFGDLIAKVFLIVYVITLFLSFFGLGIIASILEIGSSIAFFIDIYKLISKNYSMFIYEPKAKDLGLEKYNVETNVNATAIYSNPLDNNGVDLSSNINNQGEQPQVDTSDNSVKFGLNNISTGGTNTENVQENKDEGSDLSNLFR